MRTSSETSSCSASWVTVALVLPARVSLTIAKWRSPSEAICGRWVMQSSCRRCESARRREPTARAAWPPMPASTSSKTSVGAPAGETATLMIASITRASSSPEAISRSAPAVGQATAGVVGVRERRGDAGSVLAQQPLDRQEALFERVEPSAAVVELAACELLGVATQFRTELSRLDQHLPEALAEGVEAL